MSKRANGAAVAEESSVDEAEFGSEERPVGWGDVLGHRRERGDGGTSPAVRGPVVLPTLEQIDAELAEIARRRKWLLSVRRLVAKLEPDGR